MVKFAEPLGATERLHGFLATPERFRQHSHQHLRHYSNDADVQLPHITAFIR